MLAKDDPRVIASRDQLRAIPQWRLIRLWRAVREHSALVNQVIRENERAGGRDA
jgi:hypothetical protein